MRKSLNWKRILKEVALFPLSFIGMVRNSTTGELTGKLIVVNEEAGDESVVTIDIDSTKSGCRLTLVHELDPKWEEYAERTKEGWSTMLN